MLLVGGQRGSRPDAQWCGSFQAAPKSDSPRLADAIVCTRCFRYRRSLLSCKGSTGAVNVCVVFLQGFRLEVLAADPRSSMPSREQFVLCFPCQYIGLAFSLALGTAAGWPAPLLAAPCRSKAQGFALGRAFYCKAGVSLRCNQMGCWGQKGEGTSAFPWISSGLRKLNKFALELEEF